MSASGEVSVGDWLARLASANAAGDYLRAVDVAASGLAQHPRSLELLYQQCLAYARAGAGRRVLGELDRLDADGRLATLEDARLRVDFLALRGRALKDRAMRAPVGDESDAAARAAVAYERAYAEAQGGFAAINAATLWRIAGDVERSRALARAALALSAADSDPYWGRATEAEALSLLGDEAGAAQAAAAAFAHVRGRYDALAATRRQLAWLSGAAGVGAAALAALPAPRVWHWLASPDATVPPTVPRALAAHGLAAFGSWLSAADGALIEALAKSGAEINLTLPCAPQVCRARLIERAGPSAGEAFDQALARAASLSVVTAEGDPNDPTTLALAIEQARGQALIRAAALSSEAETFRLDPLRAEPIDLAAAAEDVGPWAAGRQTSSIWARRAARALVFGDVKGYSGLSEAQQPAFFEAVLGGFANAMARFGEKIEYAETAGDGLYVVVSDVATAAALTEALHASLEPRRLAEVGLPALQLRLSAHYGPVFPGRDPVTGRDKFFGKEVVRTARIEPVTPPGETYVTEQFAATAAAGGAYDFDYAGRQAMAKGFGECRMYTLRAPISG